MAFGLPTALLPSATALEAAASLLAMYLQARLVPVDRLVLGAMLICAPSPRNSTVDLNGLDNCPLETGVPRMRFLPLVVCRGLDLPKCHGLNYVFILTYTKVGRCQVQGMTPIL